MGTITPHTMSSYSTQLVGMIPRFPIAIASSSAMMQPVALAAQRYRCSR